MNLMKARAMKKKRKPAFLRCNAKSLKRLGMKWRCPKGNQNKLRRHFKSRGFLPHPGYGSPNAVKGLHPSGMEEMMINNFNDISKLDSEKHAARISAKLGKKKRTEIQKKLEEMKIKILNPAKVNK